MKKLALALSVSALATQASAATYGLVYAGLDVPFEPPFIDPGHLMLDNFSVTPFQMNGPTSQFGIYLANTSSENQGDFSYTADWTFYGASGHLLAQNVSCTSLDITDFCSQGILLGAGGSNFTSVTALSYHRQVPISFPTSKFAFDLRWTSTTGQGTYDWKITLSSRPANELPVPAAAWLFGSAIIGLVGIKRKK